MGLEVVELVIDLEDKFHVSIPDSQAEKMLTVENTVDWLVVELSKKVVDWQRPGCRSQRAFYRLRRGLESTFGTKKVSVKPDSTIGSLITDRSGRRHWPSFAFRHDLRAPKLFSLRTKSRFPTPDATIRELVGQMLELGLESFVDANGRISKERVFARVRNIVSRQLGIDESRIELTRAFFKSS